VTEEQVKKAYKLFITRHNSSALLYDVDVAAQAIFKKGGPSKGGYIAVGAGVKLVKWRLKELNLPIVSLNVSGVKAEAQPTTAFLDYMRRDLAPTPDGAAGAVRATG
jgi:hypothetical protein